MLQAGEIDAAVLGNELPKDDACLITVIEDPKGDAKAGFDRNKVIPVNHMVVVSEKVLKERPDIVRTFFDTIAKSKQAGNGATEAGIDMNPLGVDAMRHSLETIIEHCLAQKLIDRRLTVDELFNDATRGLGR